MGKRVEQQGDKDIARGDGEPDGEEDILRTVNSHRASNLASRSSEGLCHEAEKPLIRAYNLTSNDKIIRGDFSYLDIVYDEFTRILCKKLSPFFGRGIDLKYVGTEFLQFHDFMETIGASVYMSLFQFNDTQASSALIFQRQMIYPLVDGFLGGGHSLYTKGGGKDLTRVELSIVERFSGLSIEALGKAWLPISAVDCRFVKSECRPLTLGIGLDVDIAVISTFDLTIEGRHHRIVVMIPYSEIEGLGQRLWPPTGAEKLNTGKRDWEPVLAENLLTSEVEIKVNLGEVSISLKRLMELRKGDLIALEQRVGGECDIQVEEVKKYKGQCGVVNGSLAVRVKKW